MLAATSAFAGKFNKGDAGRVAEQTRQDAQQTKQDRAKLDNPKLPEQERKDIEQRITERGAQVDERVNQFPDSTAVAAAGVDYALNDRNVPKANQLGDKAVENARKSGDPEELVEAYKARAQARVAGGDKAAALEDIKAALELKKDDPDLQRLHGLIAGHAPAKGYKPPSKGFGEGDLAAKEKAGSMGAHGGAGQQPSGGASEPAKTAPQQAALQQQAQATAAQLEKQRAVERAAEGLGMDPRGARVKLDEVLKSDPKNATAWALRAKADRLIGESTLGTGTFVPKVWILLLSRDNGDKQLMSQAECGATMAGHSCARRSYFLAGAAFLRCAPFSQISISY